MKQPSKKPDSKPEGKLSRSRFIKMAGTTAAAAAIVPRYVLGGPRQNPHGEAGVVAIFAEKLVRGEPVTINGDGLQTRDYVYVEDVVAANALALGHNSHLTFNVGTGIETDVVTLYRHLAQAAGTELQPQHGPAKPGEQRRSVISPKWGGKRLGWTPKVALDEGLEITFRSFA